MLASLPSRRLFRAAAATILVVLLLAAQRELIKLVPDRYLTIVEVGVLAVAALIGAVAVRNGVGALTHGLDATSAITIRNLSTWTLYTVLGIAMASTAGLDLSGLLVGGAILGVIVAAGSQASLGNFFAGLVLMLARPYRVGASVRMRGPNLGTVEYEGTVVDLGALYTTMTTPAGVVIKLPNSAVVSSALVLGEPPLQAEIEVTLPPDARLRQLEGALRDRLGTAGHQVSIRPRVLQTGDDPRLACLVQVRSTTMVEPATLAEALAVVLTDGSTAQMPPGTDAPASS